MSQRQPMTACELITPTGYRPKAQGCEARATLGQRPNHSQPQRGCDTDTARTNGRNPVGVDSVLRPLPRVARCSQPWAGGRSPVGAGQGGAA